MIEAAAELLTGIGATTAIFAAWNWWKASTDTVPAPEGTNGVGALLGGYIIGLSGDKRIDLIKTLELQSRWNAKAASLAAMSAICAAATALLTYGIPG